MSKHFYPSPTELVLGFWGTALAAITTYAIIKKRAKVGAVYPKMITDYYPCQDGTYSDHNRARACTWHGGLAPGLHIKLGEGGGGPSSGALAVVDVPLHDINLMPDLFQNREDAFSVQTVDKIVNRVKNGEFTWEGEFDPITLWRNPENRKLYVLSGHSRFEAFRRLCGKYNAMGRGFCSIPAKIVEVSQQEAVDIALKSNTLATPETNMERASYYRTQREKGMDAKRLAELAKMNEGSNAQRILAYSYLSPNGKTYTAMKALEAGDPTSNEIIRNVAFWIGNAMAKFPQLRTLQENEMYDFLINGGYGGQYKRKEDFLKKIEIVIAQRGFMGEFSPDTPLNLQNLGQKGFSERQYDEMELEAKIKLREVTKSRDEKLSDLVSRGATRDQISNLMVPYDQAVRRAQLDLSNLMQKKSQVMQAAKNELNLFAMAGVRRRYPRPSGIAGLM